MSAGAQVAMLPPREGPEAAARPLTERRAARPTVRLAAFAALGLYGTLRWGTLETGSSWHLRLFGLLGLALALAALNLLSTRRRLIVALATAVAALVMLGLGGVPVAWIVHVRIAVTARAIGQGLSALPGLDVPYQGLNDWARTVITLGAGVLVLDAAAMLALTPPGAGALRRAAPALPLLALAAIPTTLVHPHFAYVDGLLVFVLLAAFLWGEYARRHDAVTAVLVCAAAGAAAMVLAPAVDRHAPWINYERLAGTLGPGALEHFDWSQSYGPLHWPRHGRTVLEIHARRPDYWKAEDLDVFDGRGWSENSLVFPSDPKSGVAPAAVRRFTQTLKVTDRSMSSLDVIVAGAAAGPQPVGLSQPVIPGSSPGTWQTTTPLGSGDTYLVRVYDPTPTARELASAGTQYPRSLFPGYLTLVIPAPGGTAGGVQQVVIPPFRTAPVVAGVGDPALTLDPSPYRRAYALARQLERGTRTPFDYVAAVLRYLGHGFSYNEQPLPSRYPLLSFLFDTHAGYCQQFAGAMALLLRLGGIPARVAAGFTTGTYDRASRDWLVSDVDAHAWVEAFFPGYGWVKFDPTPAADPALGGALPGIGQEIAASELNLSSIKGRRDTPAPTQGRSRRRRGHSPGGVDPVPLLVGAACLILLLGVAMRLTSPLAEPEARLAELERAFARSGRPLAPDTTLASLERRLSGAPGASDYVRALRLGRFGAGGGIPSPDQRRALRRALRSGLGVAGAVRAMWALPPRRVTARRS